MIFDNPKPLVDSTPIVNEIQKEVHKLLKPLGFRKFGRTEHRFVDGDISQVVNFQLGQAYLGDTHLLTVNIAIGVPECMYHLMGRQPERKKYYKEYECNIRSELGIIEGKKNPVYDLRKPIESIIADILRQLSDTVLPAFAILNSREAILSHRREYPMLDSMNRHLILREEAMMLRHMGDAAGATAKYDAYLYGLIHEKPRRGVTLRNRQGWLEAALKIAERSDISVSPEILAECKVFFEMT